LIIEEGVTRSMALLCANAALDKKAKNLVVIAVKEVSSFADYFIVCSGTSDRQVQAIAASVQEQMKKSGFLPIGIEGESNAKWVLMDYGDVIVHVFYEPVREFYDIEKLWADAPRMEVAENIFELKTLDVGMTL
jgi:ribosome-associated protein